MKNLVKFDIFYLMFSKTFFGLALLFSAFSIIVAVMTHNYAETSIHQFNMSYEYYEKVGDDIEESINKPYEIYEDNTIKNPLAYYYDLANTVISVASPKNIPTLFFEECTLFLPIIAILVAISLVSCDEKNKTAKVKISRNGKLNYIIAKQISGTIIMLLLITIGFISLIISENISFSALEKNFDISRFIVNSESFDTVIKQLMFTLISSIVYFEFGYIVCNVIGNYTIIAMIVTAGCFFNHPIFKYDLMNIKSILDNTFFKFNGVIHSGKPIPVPFSIIIIEIVLIMCALMAMNYLISIKRSAFK